MIEPKEYKVRSDIKRETLLYNKFREGLDYYSITKALYGNYIFLKLFVSKDEEPFLTINVSDNNGYTYAPFYNPDDRHHNEVYNEVVKNYTVFMDDLVNRKILEYDTKEINMETYIAQVNIKRLNNEAKIPTRGSEYAAGYDLYAHCQGIPIEPHKTELIGTGIAVEIPEGYFGGIFARSGLATKENLRPANCVGVVDSDYRGEVKVALHNDGNVTRIVKNGERIAQLVIIPYLNVDFEEVKELTETERGNGGFGHTGK